MNVSEKEKGEFEKRIIEYRIVTGQYPGQRDVLHPFWRGIPSDFLDVLKEARRVCPLNVILEAYALFPEPELRKRYLANCNLERFTEETLDWLVEWFGSEKKESGSSGG